MTGPPLSRQLSLGFAAALLAAVGRASADCVDVDDLRTSLAAVVDEAPADSLSEGWFELNKRLCATVDWTGAVRPVPPAIGQFLDAWRTATGVVPEVRQLLSQQILVREGGREYWPVIQEQLLPHLRDEVSAGGVVTLQFKRFGAPPSGPVVVGVQEFWAGGDMSSDEARIAVNGILRNLVATHPSPELRNELGQWIKSGEMALSVEGNALPPEMAVTLFPIDGTLRPVLLMNFEWLRGMHDQNLQRDRWSRELVLHHEYIHVKDHFSGAVPLIPLQLPRTEVEANRVEFARRLWEGEYRAVRAEWDLAKQLGATALMSDLEREITAHGDQQGFLDAFYARLLSFVSRHQIDGTMFFSEWESIYQQMKSSLRGEADLTANGQAVP